MGELSSPLQIAGLIETDCSSDRGIHSIFRFTGDDYGTPYIGFALFWSPQNDMDSEWLKDVRLLWEAGSITSHGRELLAEDWQTDTKNRVYRNNKGDTIKFGVGPFGRNGEKIDI